MVSSFLQDHWKSLLALLLISIVIYLFTLPSPKKVTFAENLVTYT
jgi:hypothetical protein